MNFLLFNCYTVEILVNIMTLVDWKPFMAERRLNSSLNIKDIHLVI